MAYINKTSLMNLKTLNVRGKIFVNMLENFLHMAKTKLISDLPKTGGRE